MAFPLYRNSSFPIQGELYRPPVHPRVTKYSDFYKRYLIESATGEICGLSVSYRIENMDGLVEIVERTLVLYTNSNCHFSLTQMPCADDELRKILPFIYEKENKPLPQREFGVFYRAVIAPASHIPRRTNRENKKIDNLNRQLRLVKKENTEHLATIARLKRQLCQKDAQQLASNHSEESKDPSEG